jgi:hypothetical protein
MEGIRLLHFKKEKFIWYDAHQTFLPLSGLNHSQQLQNILEEPQGLSKEQQELR